jgi:arylsulfatase A-like enzyme
MEKGRLLMVLFGLVTVLALSNLDATAKDSDRLNVLFIAVDDLRPELGCYGNQRVESPNIDRLAKRGVVFSRAYCQQAVCSPSRTSLLTGLRPDATKVYDLETHFRDTIHDVVTLPQHFKNHGYHAVGMGKIYHGGLDDDLSWSEPWRRPNASGYQLPDNLALIQKKRADARKRGLSGKRLSRAARGPATEMADVPDNAYPEGACADMAIETLRRVADKPFFLAVGFLKPHLPFNAPKEYWDLYQRDEIRLADNPFAPKDAPPFALTSFGELRNYDDMPSSGPVSDEDARRLIHGYLACVSYTDAQIGRILDELDRLDLTEETAIVLWGDHGWKLGEHGSWCKHTNFELDARVPMVFAAPGLRSAGKSTDALAEFVDIYPTLCDLAGLPLPSHLQGTSLVEVLHDVDKSVKSAAFSQYPRSHQGQGLMGYSMRTDRWRYTEWIHRKSGQVIARELYDHENDPAENQNVAEKMDNEVVSSLSKRLAQGKGWREAQQDN